MAVNDAQPSYAPLISEQSPRLSGVKFDLAPEKLLSHATGFQPPRHTERSSYE